MDCIFCKINKGEIPSNIIYQDEIVLAFMDAHPKSNGHILIVPKKHYNDFLDIDNETICHIHEISKLLKEAIYKSLKPDGITLVNNYGISQAVKHYHLHMIPIYKDYNELQDINEIYNKIKSVL